MDFWISLSSFAGVDSTPSRAPWATERMATVTDVTTCEAVTAYACLELLTSRMRLSGLMPSLKPRVRDSMTSFWKTGEEQKHA